MEQPFALSCRARDMMACMQHGEIQRECAACNAISAVSGLRLSDVQMNDLVVGRREALKATGRVEYASGIIRELVRAFADSPYILQETYAQTLNDLQELFYQLKTEADAQGGIADEDLLYAMRTLFDETAAGSIELLRDCTIADIGCLLGRVWQGEYEHAPHDDELDRAFEQQRKQQIAADSVFQCPVDSLKEYQERIASQGFIEGSMLS